MPKFRHNGVKREHHVLPGFLPLLEDLATHPAVAAVIPGRMRVTHSSAPGMDVRLQAPTATGHKLALRAGKTVQEVFVVARDADALLSYLEERFGS